MIHEVLNAENGLLKIQRKANRVPVRQVKTEKEP